jgi:hypothetical protein
MKGVLVALCIASVLLLVILIWMPLYKPADSSINEALDNLGQYPLIPRVSAPLPPKRFDTVIVSGTSNGKKRPWIRDTREMQREYAQRFNADYWYVDLDEHPFTELGHRRPQWQKLAIVATALPHYDHVMWIDDDAAPVPGTEKDFRALIHASGSADYIGFRDMSPQDPVNTGVFIVANTPWLNRMLNAVWHNPGRYTRENNRRGEQKRMNDLMMIPACGKVASLHKITSRVHRSVNKGHPVRSPHVWIFNEYAGNHPKSDYVMHMAGVNGKKRTARFKSLRAGARPKGLRTAYPWTPLSNLVTLRDRAPLTPSNTVYTVPKIIHQVFTVKDVVPAMAQATESWRTQNPEFEYRVYDNEDVRQFLKEHFPPDVLKAWTVTTAGAFKADVARYCILYVHGGVYADISTTCVRPIPTQWHDFVSTSSSSNRNIYQNFIHVTPRHPFLKRAIRVCVERVAAWSGFACLDVTGPGALGQAVRDVLESNASFRIGANDGGMYLLDKHVKDNYVIDPEDGVPVYSKNYKGKQDDFTQLTGANRYTIMFQKDTAFEPTLQSVTVLGTHGGSVEKQLTALRDSGFETGILVCDGVVPKPHKQLRKEANTAALTGARSVALPKSPGVFLVHRDDAAEWVASGHATAADVARNLS